jgi:hypothetical protein
VLSPERPQLARAAGGVPDDGALTAALQRAGNRYRTRKVTGCVGPEYCARPAIQLFDLPLSLARDPAHWHTSFLRIASGDTADDRAVTVDSAGTCETSFNQPGEIYSAAARLPHSGCGAAKSALADDDLFASADPIHACCDIVVVAAEPY